MPQESVVQVEIEVELRLIPGATHYEDKQNTLLKYKKKKRLDL